MDVNLHPPSESKRVVVTWHTMDMWKRSPSPEETWSDAEGGNENGEWPIKGIVGEEINPDGTPV